MPSRFRKPEGPARARDYILGLIADPDTFLSVAELDGKVVGIINAGLSRTPNLPVKNPYTFCLVRGIVVDSSFRRRGIGTALLSAAEQWSRKRGAVELQLNVYETNAPGRAFFARRGFSPLSHRLTRPL